VIGVEVANADDLEASVQWLRGERVIDSEPAVRLSEPVGDRPVRAPPEDVGVTVAVEIANARNG
jgi:hypothetical protein